MSSTWKKLVSMWKSHKARFVGALFCFVLVFGVGAQVNTVSANCAEGAAVDELGNPCASTVPDKSQNSLGETFSEATGTEYLMVTAATFINTIASSLFELVTLLIYLLIKIVAFDAFTDNAAIDVGWPIVRNAINMFVIIGLLLIAIKNLVPGQSDNANTQGQLFKILLAVVLMNFSRTITLLAVDFSQIVTITFAQAIVDIGVGNFIQLFGLQNQLVITGTSASITETTLAGSVLIGNALLKLLLTVAVAIPVIAMIAAFLVRIVLLWFLIILSPAAFFTLGIGGAFPMVGEAWQKWSEQFMGLLLFGPVMTFFLWLSLAIVSGGDLANAGFNIDGNAPSLSILASGEAANILSTIIGIIMILIGLVVSVSVASKTAGVSNILSKGQDATRGFVKWGAKKAAYGSALVGAGGLAAGASASIGLAGSMVAGTLAGTAGGAMGGYQGYKQGGLKGALKGGVAGAGAGILAGGTGVGAAVAGAYAASTLRTEGAINAAQSGVRGADRVLAKAQRIPVLGRLAAPLREATSAGAKALGGIGDARMRAAEEYIKNRDSGSLNNDLGLAKGVLESSASSPEEIANARATLKKFVTDKDFEASYRKERGDTDANKMAQEAMGVVGVPGFWDYIEDDKEKKSAKENFLKFKARNLHTMTNDADKESVLRDGDFKLDMLSESAIADDSVWNLLAKQPIVRENGTRTTMQRQIEEGQQGTRKLQKFVTEGRKPVSPELKNINWATVTQDQLKDLVNQGKVAPTQIDGASFTAGAAGYSPDLVRAIVDKVTPTNAASLDNAVATAIGSSLGVKLAGVMNLDDVKRLPAHIRAEVDRVIAANISASPGAPLVDERRHVFDGKTANLNRAFQYTAAGGFAQPAGRSALVVEVNQNPAVLSKLPMSEQAMQNTVLDEFDTGTLRSSVRRAVDEAIDSGDARQSKMLRRSLKDLQSAVMNRLSTLAPGSPDHTRWTRHHNQITNDIDDL